MADRAPGAAKPQPPPPSLEQLAKSVIYLASSVDQLAQRVTDLEKKTSPTPESTI